MLTGVELERWFCAQHFEVELRCRVAQLCKHLERLRARVQRDTRCISVYDEAVINVWFSRAYREGLAGLEAWIWFDVTQGNVRLVHRQVLDRAQDGFCTFDALGTTYGEVARQCVSMPVCLVMSPLACGW